MDIEGLPSDMYYHPNLSERQGWIYILKTPKGFKIGKSHGLKERVKQLNKEFDGEISIVNYILFDNELETKEKAFHLFFSDKNNGYKFEYFDLNNKDIELIESESFLNEIYRLEDEILEKEQKMLTHKYTARARKLVKKREKLLQDLTELNKSIKKETRLYKEYPHRIEELTKEGQAFIKSIF